MTDYPENGCADKQAPKIGGDRIALLLLVGFGLLASAMLPIAKFTGLRGLSPPALAFWQTLIAGTIQLIAGRINGHRVPYDRKHLTYYGLSGLTAIAFPNTLGFALVIVLGAGKTSLVYAFPALFTYAIAAMIGMEKPTRYRLIGLALGAIGCLVVLIPEAHLGEAGSDVIYLAVAFLIPVSLAIGNIYRSHAWPDGASPMALSTGMMFGASAILAAGIAVVPGISFWSGGFDVPLMIAVGGLGILTALAYRLFFELQKRAGPVYLSQVGYIMTIAALGYAWAFFGERPQIHALVAIAIVIAGIVIANRGQKRNSIEAG